MNAQQAVGSAESYAKRYLLLAGFGAMSGGQDQDAAQPDEFINEEQIANIHALMDEPPRTNPEKFLKYMKVDQIGHIPQSQYGKAVRALKK
jgi:hypothetical protein